MALIPSRVAISLARLKSSRVAGSSCIRPSIARILPDDTMDMLFDFASSPRSASVTTPPRLVSEAGLLKSLTRMGSVCLSVPAASSEPDGPTPSARRTIHTPTISVKTPTDQAPPNAVRRHVIHGLALSAICAMVPCVAMLPPGVSVVCIRASFAWWCTRPVNRITGSPSAITMSDPGNTQSGSPMTMIAARLRIATAMKLTA